LPIRRLTNVNLGQIKGFVDPSVAGAKQTTQQATMRLNQHQEKQGLPPQRNPPRKRLGLTSRRRQSGDAVVVPEKSSSAFCIGFNIVAQPSPPLYNPELSSNILFAFWLARIFVFTNLGVSWPNWILSLGQHNIPTGRTVGCIIINRPWRYIRMGPTRSYGLGRSAGHVWANTVISILRWPKRCKRV
jgi:hypothetical protein